MPLQDDTVYVIRNDLTHTVLDLPATAGNVSARGWGQHGGDNQQWRLIRVAGPGNENKWKLKNQLLDGDEGRFLSHQAHDPRLVGVVDEARAIFVIERIPGPSDRYRISNEGQAVALVAEMGDRHADGSRIVLEDQLENPNPAATDVAAEKNKRAQLWSFFLAPQLLQEVVEDGIYTIVNHDTGLVLDLVNNDVHGLESLNADQKWIVAKHQDGYTFKSSRVPGRFLRPDGDQRENQIALKGDEASVPFTVRKVPGTQLYKILLDGWAVNIANVAPYVVRLENTEAQTWSFI